MSEVKTTNCEEFEMLMKSENSFLIKAPIMAQEKIEKTNLLMEPSKSLEDYKSSLPSDKNTNLLVYCLRGIASSYISNQLKKLGYKNVYNLDGGMVAWYESGRHLIN